MASGITVHQQPSGYTPAYAPQIFEATSTNIAATNFTYTVIVTDLITSETETYQIEQRPITGELVFDAKEFVNNYIRHYCPNNAYGFKLCTDAIRKIRVNIGETYGSTPVYTAGSNIDYIVWNAALAHLDYPSYASTAYVYNSFTTNYVYLSGVYSNITYSDKSSFLYVLATGAGDLTSLRIETYNAANTLIGTSHIANPYSASGTYTDKYTVIDVGHKGLSQISAGLVTGAYPIITASVDHYVITDETNSTAIKSYTIGCEAKHDIYVLQYLHINGRFETLNVNRKSELKVNNNKTTYNQNPWTLASNTWSYSNNTAQKKVLDSSSTKSISVNSDWMTNSDIEFHSHIINSPVVYLDYGSTTGLIPVVVKTNSMTINKKWNEKLMSISLELDFTYTDVWQND